MNLRKDHYRFFSVIGEHVASASPFPRAGWAAACPVFGSGARRRRLGQLTMPPRAAGRIILLGREGAPGHLISSSSGYLLSSREGRGFAVLLRLPFRLARFKDLRSVSPRRRRAAAPVLLRS